MEVVSARGSPSVLSTAVHQNVDIPLGASGPEAADDTS
jgi:hypothetical protein